MPRFEQVIIPHKQKTNHIYFILDYSDYRCGLNLDTLMGDLWGAHLQGFMVKQGCHKDISFFLNALLTVSSVDNFCKQFGHRSRSTNGIQTV